MTRSSAGLAAAALAISLVTACSKPNQSAGSDGAKTVTATGAGAAVAGALGDPVRGKQIFSANCAQCHGATGVEGGIGPSLAGERSRKTYPATVAWIENPSGAMPKLYPEPLSERDVDDVAAYVQQL
jgi:ubiquinol-cytochrome c reductase cytochrome c subunit